MKKTAGFLLLLLSVVAISFSAQYSSGKFKALVSVYQYPDFLQKPPVEIIAIKVNGKDIHAGRKFLAGEDWLKSFTVAVQNVSHHNIKFIEAEIEFPRDSQRNSILPNVGMFVGHTMFLQAGEDLTLKPSETVELSVLPSQFAALRRRMSEKNMPPSGINWATFRVIIVRFDNDKGWTIGYPTKRDPNDPNNWLRDDATDESPSTINVGT